MSSDGIVRLNGNIDIEAYRNAEDDTYVAYLSAWIDPTNQSEELLDALFSGEWDAIEVHSSLSGALRMMIEGQTYWKTGNLPESQRGKFDCIRGELAALIDRIDSLTYEADRPDIEAPDQA